MVKKLIDEKRVIYDYKADRKGFKWSGESKLKKMDNVFLPRYVANNLNKYLDWLD